MRKLIIILMVLIGMVYAADDSETVNVKERQGKVLYYGTVSVTDTANAATYYTQWFYIGGANYEYGYGNFIMNEVGTEDVNVFIEYSNDNATPKTGATDSDLDAVGATIVYDTLGIADGVVDPYNRFMFARFKFVLGQENAGTGTTPVITWQSLWVKPKASNVFRQDIGLVLDDE